MEPFTFLIYESNTKVGLGRDPRWLGTPKLGRPPYHHPWPCQPCPKPGPWPGGPPHRLVRHSAVERRLRHRWPRQHDHIHSPPGEIPPQPSTCGGPIGVISRQPPALSARRSVLHRHGPRFYRDGIPRRPEHGAGHPHRAVPRRAGSAPAREFL